MRNLRPSEDYASIVLYDQAGWGEWYEEDKRFCGCPIATPYIVYHVGQSKVFYYDFMVLQGQPGDLDVIECECGATLSWFDLRWGCYTVCHERDGQ